MQTPGIASSNHIEDTTPVGGISELVSATNWHVGTFDSITIIPIRAHQVSTSTSSAAKSMKELEYILATYPPEQVIDRIEELNPIWKHDLLPWKIAKPGEKIPWQAVYIIKHQTTTPEALAWAEKRLAELKAAGDVP
jgi:hypothetical protein